ncbi:succinylglutamate desuccinylase/aspartoacylase family protein [Halobaculum sp. CBA1158]|uniref:succinylglutamate desuccinylase/aspartoacylase domain-containing protein n=1 Tax=Halobaculum sp. CBA1158 TaxID=2904243 RepID=UPI001F1CF410|nr:succinylglutamate desuccinylase/aspartoacylase family protein [Halobaculum sp. CBA1158]UIO98539.1 succinylglutamate desuccinylase/aspartoacylase family protein [Halobaculum sp. CBA1158]
MQVHQLGDGVPEVAVVAGIHGDEPCGPRAVERLLAEDPSVERPAKLIVANEEALDAGERYHEEDLNRAFPGDPDGDTHESQLAHHLQAEVESCTVLSLHSTQSFAEPFALCETVDEVARATVPALPVDVLVETDRFADGRLIQHPHTVEVECGLQGSDEAADNAYRLTTAFLSATGVLSSIPERDAAALPGVDGGGAAGDASPTDPDASPTDPETAAAPTVDSEAVGDAVEVFRLLDPIAKPPAERYEVLAENFERVAVGEAFAEADGETFTADRPFHPVLMSAYGYADVFGYAAERVGTL